MKKILISAFLFYYFKLISADCPPMDCPDTYDPYCAWNYTANRMVTLQNECVLDYQYDCINNIEETGFRIDAELLYKGECHYSLCADNCYPIDDDDYVCGYNKKYELYRTFSTCQLKGWNRCTEDDMDFEILYHWTCEDKMTQRELRGCSQEKCTEEYSPVCVFFNSTARGNSIFVGDDKYVTFPRNCTWERRNKCALEEWFGYGEFAYNGECIVN